MKFWFLDLLCDFGVNITENTFILDFGCGNGYLVKSLLESGFKAKGCDLKFKHGKDVDFLTKCGLINNINIDPYQLPYDDNTFDIIITNQVMEHVQNYEETIVEMRRVLKPGGVCLHMFPSQLKPIESHVYIPFASIIRNYPYLLIWAILGVKKNDQVGMNAKTIAKANQTYLKTCTNYLSGKQILNYFQKGGFEKCFYIEDLFLKNSPNKRGRLLYKLGLKIPVIFAIYRLFWTRVLIAY
jgi:2-polyprenyl-3-methyl-5-hydroxy-6-metoxy-1,4-benzoquinol methylase